MDIFVIQKKISLEELLRSYVAPENIFDYCCDKCSLHETVRNIQNQIRMKQRELDKVKKLRNNDVSLHYSHDSKTSPRVIHDSPLSVANNYELNSENISGDGGNHLKESIKILLHSIIKLEKDLEIVRNAYRFDVEAQLVY